MPRPRSQRAAAAGAAADAERILKSPPPAAEEQVQPRRNRDPAQEQILRSLPNALSRELKMAALEWRGGCFCCPANISFAQCMAGLWQAARKSTESAEAQVHWGLNASKFLFEAGPKSSFGRKLLLQAGLMSLLPQLLPISEEVPQSISLTPQVFFVQIYGTGGRQVPLSTTPQLVVLGLLALATLSPGSLRSALAPPAGPQLLAALVRTLAASSDDRLRSLTFQTLTEWINIYDGDPLVDDDDDDDDDGDGNDDEDEDDGNDNRQKEYEDANNGNNNSATANEKARIGKKGNTAAIVAASFSSEALIDALLDVGLASAVVHVLESSSNAAVLRDACAFLLAMLTGGVGGGVEAGATGGGGRKGAGHHGAAAGAGVGSSPGPMRVVGMTAMELPAGAVLEGQARCRARTELLKAGLVSALLSALSRRPSQLSYWVAINMGVSGARHLEMQWLMLVIARMSVLPSGPPMSEVPSVDGGGGGGGTEQPTADVTSDGVAAIRGGKVPTTTGISTKQQRGRMRTGVQDPAAAERLRLAAADMLVQSPIFSPWWDSQGLSIRPPEATEAAAPECGQTGTSSDSDATAGGGENTVVPPQPPLQPSDVRAVLLLSRAIAASTLRSCVLPDGTPLESLPPKDRNVTPDFRALQRDRIRKAMEEARAAQALASANSAVDVLSKAVAFL